MATVGVSKSLTRSDLCANIAETPTSLEFTDEGGEASGTKHRLESALDPYDIANERGMDPVELPQEAESPGILEDRSRVPVRPQFFRPLEGIQDIVLRAAAPLPDAGSHDLLHVWGKDLVKPGALRAFLEAKMLLSRQALQVPYQRRTVGLDDFVPDLTTVGSDDGERAALAMRVQSEVPFHGCPPAWGSLVRPTERSQKHAEDAT